MQTAVPYWLAESYASVINEIDIGPINRAVAGSKIVKGIILSMFHREGKFIDYGAGYGVLVRMMRDLGFDFYWCDKYCDNIFAKHFVADRETRFELLTAFEIFEHLVDPLSEIKAMLAFSDNLLFSTLLVPNELQKRERLVVFCPRARPTRCLLYCRSASGGIQGLQPPSVH